MPKNLIFCISFNHFTYFQIETLKSVRHKNIVAFHGVYEITDQRFCLVLGKIMLMYLKLLGICFVYSLYIKSLLVHLWINI